MIVVDASLAVKWYGREAFTPEAIAFLDDNLGQVAAPDIFVTEVIGALVRRANIDKCLRPEVDASIARFVRLFQQGLAKAYRIEPPAMAHAASLALDLGHPLKDCIYLALAMELGCELVTCDARFAAKARGVWDRVRVLGE